MNTENSILLTTSDIPVSSGRMNAIEKIINSTTEINLFPHAGAFYENLSNGVSSINNLKLGDIDADILSPVVSADLKVDSKGEELLNVSLLLTAKTSEALHKMAGFQINYQLTLNDYGLPHLNIYVLYSEPNTVYNSICTTVYSTE
jgi:hypothetical protein